MESGKVAVGAIDGSVVIRVESNQGAIELNLSPKMTKALIQQLVDAVMKALVQTPPSLN